MNLYLLHGFLGRSTDWDSFNFHELKGVKEVIALNIFDKKSKVEPLEKWAATFIGQIKKKEKNSVKKPLILGYSLGGRLILHLLKQDPSLFSAAICISTNLGIPDKKKRAKRLEHDLHWKELFQTMEWNALIQKWNDQEIFTGFKETFNRKEIDYSRNNLAEVLDRWSTGRQHYFGKEIENLDLPILWIAGERDSKYMQAAASLQFKNKDSRTYVAKDCGHRLPWQNKEDFIKNIQIFIETIERKSLLDCRRECGSSNIK